MYDVTFFKEELSMVEDKVLRSMTEAVLRKAPKWFYIEPASITGRHHPPDDLVEGGLCIHSRKVAWLAYRYFEAFEEDTDIGVCAALLHDTRQRGSGDEIGDIEDYKIHAEAAAGYLIDYGSEERAYGLSEEGMAKWKQVCSCVGSHMGRWGTLRPGGMPQILFHLADVGASMRLFVGLQFFTSDTPALPDVLEAGKHIVERNGERYINFGKKHYRKLLLEVARKDPGYLKWMLRSGFPDDVAAEVKAVQAQVAAERRKQTQLDTGNLPLG